MKILYLTKYSRKGASSRLRSYQYFPFLEENDIAITNKPLFDDQYLDSLYSKKKLSPLRILSYYVKRFFVLFSIFNYDKVVIEKELFPYFFSWFESILKGLGVKYVVDYDDAIFHNYDLSNNKLILFFLKNKINNVMKNSHAVIAGNNYLAQRATVSGAKNIIIIPTVIDIKQYHIKDNYQTNQVVIGWIGSPSTLKYLKPLVPVFEEIIKKYNCKIHIIGAKEDLGISKNVDYFPWSEDKEVLLIRNFDIGIMPLDNTPWELGKCSYKLIQYMGCAIPVVASPVGMNVEVVDEKINGFLATTKEQWLQALITLIENPAIREQFGKKGRQKVEKLYSLEQTNPQYLKTLL
ncbi:MAG: glycosyltransferase family 4 protein [Flavobacterium sp.]|uniref:glycosyltransferase family 4 protein n=1 Tax=Flavobacterium sp. TaxID=239 RepID=UPI003265C787